MKPERFPGGQVLLEINLHKTGKMEDVVFCAAFDPDPVWVLAVKQQKTVSRQGDGALPGKGGVNQGA